MPRIFSVKCPKCEGVFQCHSGDLRGKPVPLLCPYCGEQFRQEDSPEIKE